MDFLVPETIETDRLILRQFSNEDWKDIHAYNSDIEATKYTYGHSLTEGESWRVMASILGHWQLKKLKGSVTNKNTNDSQLSPTPLILR